MNENKNEIVEFIPKNCPTCGDLLSVRKLGCWGYYCVDCMMWWGTYEPYPKVTVVENFTTE